MHQKKDYIIVKDRHPRFSEVLNDCISLCVPTSKNEPLSSVLQKICGKITQNYTSLSQQIEDIDIPVYVLEDGENTTVNGTGAEDDPWSVDVTFPDPPVYAVEEGSGISITGDGSEGDPWVFSSTIVDTNFATSNLTATANRTHNWANFGLVFSQLNSLEMSGPTGSVGSIAFYPRALSGDQSNQTLAQFSTSSTHTMSNGNSSTNLIAFRDSTTMSPSGGSGSFAGFTFEGLMNHSGSYSGTTRAFRVNPFVFNSLGPFIAFDMQGTWFAHSGSSFRGFYYHPNLTGSFSGSNIAWENTSGDLYFNNGANAGRAGFHSITTPTAWVHIGAGAAGTNSAPLKLTAGTNMTTPENGAFEYDGTNLYFTTGGTRYTVQLNP